MSKNKYCNEKGCKNKSKVKGLCRKHYDKKRRENKKVKNKENKLDEKDLLRWLRWEAEVRASRAILDKFNIQYDETIKKYPDIVKLINDKNKSAKDLKEKNKIYNDLIQELCRKYNITSKNIAINSANGKITILDSKE